LKQRMRSGGAKGFVPKKTWKHHWGDRSGREIGDRRKEKALAKRGKRKVYYRGVEGLSRRGQGDCLWTRVEVEKHHRGKVLRGGEQERLKQQEKEEAQPTPAPARG